MPRIGLDTAKVVAAAADMADLEGIEAVTISSLARVFGVSHAALYNHVGNIEDLRIEIAIFGLRELADDVTNITVGRARREAVFALASAYVAFARRRPGVYSTTLRAANPGHLRHAAAANALLRVVYRTLEGFGIEGDDLCMLCGTVAACFMALSRLRRREAGACR